jgi:hypothetical protein
MRGEACGALPSLPDGVPGTGSAEAVSLATMSDGKALNVSEAFCMLVLLSPGSMWFWH